MAAAARGYILSVADAGGSGRDSSCRRYHQAPPHGFPCQERSAMGRSNRPITSFTLRIRRTDQIREVGDEPSEVVGDHDHVDSSVDRQLDAVLDPGQKVGVSVHLDAVPAGVGCHHRGDPHGDGVEVRPDVDMEEVWVVGHCVVFVHPARRATVPGEADVVGEDGGADDVVVTVHGVRPVEDGNA
ncbi:unnamed protein product [Spirodela intermedia]|uniref:Uncharacterized protein n=1 Tax=Spirodela intermedia TaxID=51605 RepID=A0A7I8J4N4_SPIIN|nr:unnamed protein product [Spirodela intermedia]CAA6664725.1 unnamed protein product [Spirodela intermedia]